ncbi:acetamidase/formamidase family protein [Natronococcus amylolyticus DSM 10524]|uniref:Acetamidase/formamidase family protein n=1 Tax=Natronococcus amylolyticus DSM 10524 TaxID=1227497 RepID=L9XFJ0_9EURY|nr:formamidase [Natronococcus amylolyticus]ELY59448.1 acetamidase/formamidase family protein [Natronococcus amylolyticus DSM 10524]
MPETVFEVDTESPPDEQPDPIVNRWHPDVPPVSSIEPGEKVRIECLDWTGGQVNNDDSANDIRDMELDPNHHLSGPFEVEGAEPGDMLVVDILDLGAFPDHEWGFNAIFDQENGGGFLTDHFPEARKSIWELDGVMASTRHIEDVRFPGCAHPGILGTAPSQELLEEWNERERALIERGPDDPTAVNHETGEAEPPLALPPEPNDVLLGDMDDDQVDDAAEEAARTIPPRENAGNCDIKNLGRGSRVYLPVFVDGANFIVGDLHFSQGDGEISFCGAIEFPGWIDLKVDVIKDGMEKMGTDYAMFKPGYMDPDFSNYVVFEGYSVDEDGTQHYKNANIGMRRACLDAIDYMTNFGYSAEQAYMLLSTAPVESRIAGIVDLPNTCVTVSVPQEIFEFDVDPDRLADGGPDESRGDVAKTS